MELILQIASLSGGVLLALAYVPQILALYRNKTADGVSLSFWLILDSALLMLFITAVGGYMETGSLYMVSLQTVNLFLALVVTGQVIYYGGKR